MYQSVIFTSNELKILRWVDGNSFQKRLSYNIKNKKFITLRKWIYVLAGAINSLWIIENFQIANRMYSPSYISFETVLFAEGVIFQYHGNVTVASPYTKDIYIEPLLLSIEYFSMPKALLINPFGLIQKDWYVLATKERALCDVLLRSGNYYFDRLSDIDWDLVLQIAKYYKEYHKTAYESILFLVDKHYAKKWT